MGAHGVMVPLVRSGAEAKHAACAEYPPHGRRGAASGFARDNYMPGTPGEKMQAARDRTLVIVEGLDNADAIAARPGIDVVWLRHLDRTNFRGISGQFQHPDYLAAIHRVAVAARANDKVAGFGALHGRWRLCRNELTFRICCGRRLD